MREISVLSVIGARPQFIKASIVSRMLRKTGIKEIVVHTGQHYDYNMSDIFFKELFDYKPDFNLDVKSASHGIQTGRMLIGIEEIIKKERPGMVLVYGDTNSTLAGALAASKLNIPVAHVESGLRSYDKSMPEEVNRVLTDHISKLLFVPTETAVSNLKKEGITENVFNVGDVMYDLVVLLDNEIKRSKVEVLNKFGVKEDEFILVTIHRAANTDNRNRLESIFSALKELAGKSLNILFPVHPRTRKFLSQYGLLSKGVPENFLISDPVSYKEMLVLESSSKLIITDSGGVQKEAYFFKKPSIIPRRETEWIELVDSGWAVLTDADKKSIVDSVLKLLDNYEKKSWISFYGDGKSSEKIVGYIKKYLDEGQIYGR